MFGFKEVISPSRCDPITPKSSKTINANARSYHPRFPIFCRNGPTIKSCSVLQSLIIVTLLLGFFYESDEMHRDLKAEKAHGNYLYISQQQVKARE